MITNLVELALTPNQVMPLRENLKIPGWLFTQDWYELSMTMVAR